MQRASHGRERQFPGLTLGTQASLGPTMGMARRFIYTRISNSAMPARLDTIHVSTHLTAYLFMWCLDVGAWVHDGGNEQHVHRIRR